MWSTRVVQQDLRTPTGRSSVRFSIAGIHGLAFEWRSMRRSTFGRHRLPLHFDRRRRPPAGASGLDVRSGCLSRCLFFLATPPLSPWRGYRALSDLLRDALKRRAIIDRVALRRIMCLSQRGCGRGPCQPHDETPNEGTEPTGAAASRDSSTCSAGTGRVDRRCADMVRPSGRGRSELIGLMRRLILEHVDREQRNRGSGGRP